MKDALNVKVYADLRNYQMAMARLPGITQAATARASSAVMGLALAVGAVGIAATRVGATFQQTMVETATVTKASTAEFDKMIKKARELGKTTTFTASQAGKGMYYLASAGFNATEVVQAADYALKLAGATASDVDYTMASVASTLKQFGLAASETKRVTDTFAQAISTSQLTLWRLTEALKYAGTAGAGFGLSLEETVAALAQYANLGLEGSMIGTQFRRAMTMAAKGTAKSEEALRNYGMTQRDINPEMVGFVGILEKIGNAGVNATDAIKMFGIRAGANMARLGAMYKAGLLPMQEYTQSLLKAQEGIGRTQEMYNQMMDTFKSQGIIVISALQDLLIEIFNLYSNEGKSAFEGLTKEIWKLTDAVYRNREELSKWAGHIIQAITVVFQAFKVLGAAIWNARKILIWLLGVKVGLALASWVKSIYDSLKAVKLLTLSLTMLGSWVTILAALIIGAFSFKHLYDNFKTFRNVVDTSLAAIEAGWIKLKSTVARILETLLSTARVVFNDLVGFVLRPIKFIVRKLVNLADAAPDWMKPDYYQSLRDSVMEWATATNTTIKVLLEETERLSLALTDIDEEERKAILAIQTKLKLRLLENEAFFKNKEDKKKGLAEINEMQARHAAEVQKIIDLYQDIPESMMKRLDVVFNKYHELFDLGSEWKKILDTITETYRAARTEEGKWAKSVTEAEKEKLQALLKYIGLLGKRLVLERRLSAMSASISYIKDLRDYNKEFGTILQGMAAGWNDYWDGVMTKSEFAADTIKQTLEGLHDAFSNTLFMGLKGDMEDFEKTWEDFSDRLIKILTDRMSTNFMGTIRDSLETGALGSMLDKIGLGGLSREILKTKKDPRLQMQEAQLDLQIKDLDIQQKILAALLSTKQIDESTKQAIENSTGQIGPGSISGNDIDKYMDMLKNGGGNQQGNTDSWYGPDGKMRPSTMNGPEQQSKGGAFGSGFSYGDYASAAYGMYQVTNKDQYKGMSSTSGAMSGAIQGAQYGAAFGLPGVAAGAVIGGVAGGVLADDSEEKGRKRAKEYIEEIQKLLDTDYQSLTRMSQDFENVISPKSIHAMIEYGGVTHEAGQALYAMADIMKLVKGSAEKFGTVLNSVTNLMNVNFEAIEEYLFIAGEKGGDVWKVVEEMHQKMQKLAVDESMRRASASLSDAAQVQYRAFIELRNGTDLLTIANNQADLSMELLGNTLGKTNKEIVTLYETYRKVRGEQVRLNKAQEETDMWLNLISSDVELTDKELLAITGRLEQLGTSMTSTFQQVHGVFDKINERLLNTTEMVANMPASMSGPAEALYGILQMARYISTSGEAIVTLVEGSSMIAESWKEIAESIQKSDLDGAAAGLAKMGVAYGDIASSMIQLSQIADKSGMTGVSQAAGGIGGLFMGIEAFITITQVFRALANVINELVILSAQWVSRNDEMIEIWKNLEEATKNLPFIGKWVSKFVERIDSAADDLAALPFDKLLENNENIKQFMDDLNETIRTFSQEGTIADLRSNVEYFTEQFGLGMIKSFDTTEEGIDQIIKDATNLKDALVDLGQALRELKNEWEDFIDDINTTQKDLRTEYMKPAEKRKYAMDEWVTTYQEYMRASDEERLEKAQELKEIAMDWYNAEKDMLLEKHTKEMDRAQELIGMIDTLKDRQTAFLESIDNQLENMKQNLGSPGDQFTATRLQIEDLKSQIARASGEDRLDLIEELQKLYDTYLGQASSLFGNNSTNYNKVWTSVNNGLTKIKEQYKVETDSMIENHEDELEALTGTRDTTKAIEELAEKQRLELVELNNKWAGYFEWFKTDANVEINNLDTEIDKVVEAIAGVGTATATAIGMLTFPADPLSYEESKNATMYGVLGAFTTLGFAAWILGRGLDVGMDYVPYDQWRYLHEGESVIRKGQPEATGQVGGSTNFVFVPYSMSEMEQERLFDEVIKPQLMAQSANEQFIYDNTIIKTNRGT